MPLPLLPPPCAESLDRFSIPAHEAMKLEYFCREEDNASFFVPMRDRTGARQTVAQTAESARSTVRPARRR
jgi:hypothetical protein